MQLLTYCRLIPHKLLKVPETIVKANRRANLLRHARVCMHESPRCTAFVPKESCTVILSLHISAPPCDRNLYRGLNINAELILLSYRV